MLRMDKKATREERMKRVETVIRDVSLKII